MVRAKCLRPVEQLRQVRYSNVFEYQNIRCALPRVIWALLNCTEDGSASLKSPAAPSQSSIAGVNMVLVALHQNSEIVENHTFCRTCFSLKLRCNEKIKNLKAQPDYILKTFIWSVSGQKSLVLSFTLYSFESKHLSQFVM